MNWLRDNRRRLAFAALWAVSSVVMGTVIALSARRAMVRYVLDPEFFAQVNSTYLRARLKLSAQETRRAYEIMREGQRRQVELIVRRQAAWADIFESLAKAPDQEVLEKRKTLQSINAGMPEINVGMVVQLRNALPPEKRDGLIGVLYSNPMRYTGSIGRPKQK